MKALIGGFASVGFFICVLLIAGSVGIGDFRLYYGPDFNQSNMCKGAK